MFGLHKLRERKLEKSGKAATAVVISSEYNMGSGTAGYGATILCKMKLQVQPEGEPAFEASLDAWMDPPPSEGDSVPVVYDPADHSKLIIDRRAEDAQIERWQEMKREAADRRLQRKLRG